MWPRVNQMSRTLLFHTHFSQIRYQIKANTPTHNGQLYQIIFVSSVFEVKHFIPGEVKLFWMSLFILKLQEIRNSLYCYVNKTKELALMQMMSF